MHELTLRDLPTSRALVRLTYEQTALLDRLRTVHGLTRDEMATRLLGAVLDQFKGL